MSYTLASIFEESNSPAEYARRYAERLSALLAELDFDAVVKMIDMLDEASQNKRFVYFIANGGSAAVASHWVNDLVAGGFLEGRPGFRALCLSDNVESVTAIGNDSGFENIFVNQLKVNMDPGDVVFAMSVSGNSENIIRAVDWAKSHGGKTIGVSGFKGARLKDRCDVNLHIPSSPDEYGPVEDIFGILEHMVTGYLTMRRGKKLQH